MFLIDKLIEARKFVIIVAALLFVIFGLLALIVPVNYDMYDYLPKESKSIVAVDISEENFDDELPNLNAAVKVSSLSEVEKYRREFESIKGISNVQSVDDLIDVSVPLSFYAEDDYKDYYVEHADFQGEKDVNILLFRMFAADEGQTEILTKAQAVVDGKGTLTGGVVEDNGLADSTSKNSLIALIILIPLVLIVLFLITKSFFAPFLVLLTIGLAVIINMGTNAFMKDVSFVTFTVSPVLQFAVSLDYSIFLLFAFKKEREIGDGNEAAMKRAVKSSFPVIVSCGLTTVFGFIALCFMKLGIGANLGLALGKGILITMLSSLIFFPAIVLVSWKLIEKTTIRFKERKGLNVGRYIFKARLPIFLLIVICIVPAFLAGNKVDFEYGASSVALSPKVVRDTDELNKYFPREDTLLIFVKSGDDERETRLVEDLKERKDVRSVISYQSSVGEDIPKSIAGDEAVKNFYSGDWARLIVYYDASGQEQNSFSTFKGVRKATEKYYPGDASFISGSDAVVSDLKDVVTKDNFMVNIVVIISILLIILLTFRSLIMPVILVATIETAIWINFAIPYFSGNSYMYIGYLIISTVLLGSTVDYAILLSNKYLEHRKTLTKKPAIIAAINESGKAILMSAFILVSAGTALAISTDNEMILQMGFLIARGAALSFVLVIFFLPAALYFLDGLIKRLGINYKMV